MSEHIDHTVPDVDFLPEKYRQQSAQRKTNVWRIVVVTLFAGMLVTTSLLQLRTRTHLEAELTRIEPLFAAANLEVALLAELQQQGRQSEARARLAAFVQHRWATTQIVDVVLRPLPEAIHVRNLQIARESSALPNSLSYNAEAGPADAGPAGDPALDDLNELKKEIADRPLVVTMAGTTDEVAALHAYLGAIGRHRMIAKAELLSIERGDGERSGEAEFQVKLMIRPPRGVGERVAESIALPPREVPHG